MKSKKRELLEEELNRLTVDNKNNFAKALYHLKRNFDDWSLTNLSRAGYPDMKVSYMAFLMNIGLEGITNNDLAKRILVTKQAISKTLKELEQLNLIEMKPNPSDARSSLILLTDYGIKMVINCRTKVGELTEQYIEVIGKKRYYQMLESLNAIINIHTDIRKAKGTTVMPL